MKTAEVQQARMLMAELREAISELEAQIESAEARWAHRLHRSSREIETPPRLVRLRTQLDQAQRLLTRLRSQQAKRSKSVADRPAAGDQTVLDPLHILR
jgi:DNA repair exonuclease SbcCD ATPase subunit